MQQALRVVMLGTAIAAVLWTLGHAQAVQGMGAKPATRTTPDQLRIVAPDTNLTTAGVKLLAYSGTNFYEVGLGENVALMLREGGLVLSSTATAVPAPVVTVVYPDMNVRAARQTDGTYLLEKCTAGKVVQLIRNGVVQHDTAAIAPGDYAVDPTNACHVIPASTWDAGDVVYGNLFPVGGEGK